MFTGWICLLAKSLLRMACRLSRYNKGWLREEGLWRNMYIRAIWHQAYTYVCLSMWSCHSLEPSGTLTWPSRSPQASLISITPQILFRFVRSSVLMAWFTRRWMISLMWGSPWTHRLIGLMQLASMGTIAQVDGPVAVHLLYTVGWTPTSNQHRESTPETFIFTWCSKCFLWVLSLLFFHLFNLWPSIFPPGDIDDAYLQRLEDKGRGAGRDRPGQDLKYKGSNNNDGKGSAAKGAPVYIWSGWHWWIFLALIKMTYMQ